MAYNEVLTNRVREALIDVPNIEEKKMFGGIAFMVNGKMCITAGDNELMCRIDPDLYEGLIDKKGCHPVIMRQREYKGYIYVHEDAIKRKKDLDYWVQLCLDYNKYAKASKKKQK